MIRQVKIAIATFVGLAAGAVMLLVQELTSPRGDYGFNFLTREPITPFTWVQGVVMLDMPIAGLVVLVGLVLLEFIQPKIKAPRLLFFVIGALALAAVLGGMFSFAAAQFFTFDPTLFERAFGFDTVQGMVVGLFMLPALVASASYVWLTKDLAPGSKDPLPQEPFAVEVPASSAPTLQTAPDSHRMIAIMTSPTERIGQRAFLYALRLWSTAAAIGFYAPILIAGSLGMDDDGKYFVAAFGWVALFWSAFCITANRMHDLGMSAVWAGVPAFAAFAWVILETPADKPLISTTTATHSVIALFFCYAAAAALLIIRKGDPYANQYGDASV